MLMSTLASLLKDLSGSLGWPSPRLDDKSEGATLYVDNRIEIHFEKGIDGETAHLYATVIPLPAAGHREPVYQAALEANMFGYGTRSSVFGINTEGGQLILFRNIDLGSATLPGVRAILEEFIGVLESWRPRFERLAGAGAGGSSHSAIAIRP
jgi:hypothetical protein